MWPLWGVILQRFIPSDRDGGHEEANMQTAVTGLLGWLVAFPVDARSFCTFYPRLRSQ